MGSGYSSSSADTEPVKEVTFTINGQPYTVHPDGLKITATTTLNTFLREHAHLTGTKLMCLEGGCGSCIVDAQWQDPISKAETHHAINSCLVTVLSCQDWKITTVEGIGNKKDGYNVVQNRLAEFNGTQCGFCSPGMVMNMYSLYQSEDMSLSSKQVENSFGGNICRCTGYRSIADSFKTLTMDCDAKLMAKCQDMEDLKICPKNGEQCTKTCVAGETNTAPRPYVLVDTGSEKWFKVYQLKEILEVLTQIGDAKYMLVAGNTAHGVFRRDTDIQVFIDVNSVKELHEIDIGTEVSFGGNTTLTDTMKIMHKVANEKPEFAYMNEMYDHIDLVANVPVRNVGTLAGNLMIKHRYPSFQSDIFLTFETFGGKLNLVSKDGTETNNVSIKDFLAVDMNGKVITKITLPPLTGKEFCRTYKIMPRSQNTHAIVNAGFLFKMEDDNETVKQATIVFGAINEAFVHASRTEQLLVGKKLFDDAVLQDVYQSLESELEPHRAPPEPEPEVRKRLAIALFYKFILSIAPESQIAEAYRSGGEKFDRPVSSGTQEYQTQKQEYPLTKPIPKIEALAQCSGEAKYVVDHLPEGALFGAFVLARTKPLSTIIRIDSDAALKIPGVVKFFSSKDIMGMNTFTPLAAGSLVNEEIFCSGKVMHNGQPIGMIVAETQDIANYAAKFVTVEYDAPSGESPVFNIRDALKIPNNPRIKEARSVERKASKGTDVKKVIKGSFDIGGQFHFTMETQSCVCIPIEDGMDVYPSTQWMDLTQIAISQACQIPENTINVYVRRLGGGYGSKITRSSQVSTACAIAAHNLNKPVYVRMLLEDNMDAIGMRYPCSADYEVAVNAAGKIQYLDISYWEDYGNNTNEPVAGASMDNFFNCYVTDTWQGKGYGVFTDMAVNTYCRAPASTEGIAMVESLMDNIAIEMNLDPRSVREQNMKPDNALRKLVKSYGKESEIDIRTKEIADFNKENRWKKRGLSVTVMDYPFEYFGNFGVLISIYGADATVAVSHGGIEMGQGINTKVAQVCAYAFGIDVDMVTVKPSNVLCTPNNMVSGGSVTSESCCYATLQACDILKKRMQPVKDKMKDPTWAKVVQASRLINVDLCATYTFTPKDNVKGYRIYGVTFCEVEVDLLTGQNVIKRVDLLEDTGESMSPEVDIGQVEGAYMMGAGYWLLEKLVYDENGANLTDRTWTYRPMGLKDIPIDWRILFQRNSTNPSGVLRSKATGEPPLCMSIGVATAVRHALASARRDADPEANPWIAIDGPTNSDYIIINNLSKYSQYKLK